METGCAPSIRFVPWAGIVLRLCLCRIRAPKPNPSSATVSFGVAGSSVYRIPLPRSLRMALEAIWHAGISLKLKTLLLKPICRSSEKLPDGSTQYETAADWFSVQASRTAMPPFWPHSRKRFSIGTLKTCSNVSLRHRGAQCTFNPVRTFGVQNENWDRVPSSVPVNIASESLRCF